MWGKMAQEQKVTGKKQNSGWNPPPTVIMKQLLWLMWNQFRKCENVF